MQEPFHHFQELPEQQHKVVDEDDEALTMGSRTHHREFYYRCGNALQQRHKITSLIFIVEILCQASLAPALREH